MKLFLAECFHVSVPELLSDISFWKKFQFPCVGILLKFWLIWWPIHDKIGSIIRFQIFDSEYLALTNPSCGYWISINLNLSACHVFKIGIPNDVYVDNWKWIKCNKLYMNSITLPFSTCTVTLLLLALDGLHWYTPESDGWAFSISKYDVDASSFLVVTRIPPRGES